MTDKQIVIKEIEYLFLLLNKYSLPPVAFKVEPNVLAKRIHDN